MEKIKILHCLETMAFGGVERTKLSIAKGLDKDVFDQKVVCTHASDDYRQRFANYNVDVVQVGVLEKPFQWEIHKKVQNVIDQYKPDIIHGAVFEGVHMAAINGIIKNVPHIILEETSDPINRSSKANYLLKFYSLFADRFVGVSQAAYNYLHEKVSKKKAYLINNGVQEAREVSPNEKENIKSKLGITNEFIVGCVGRMIDDNQKRFSDIILAARILKDENIKYLFVGGGICLPEYKDLAKKLGVQEKIIFTDYQTDVDLYYAIMDTFILPSRNESFGLVLAEAMYHSLPVIGTNVGGIKYIIKDQETGFLINVGAPEEIADKIMKLFKNPILLEEMGRLGYHRVIENFSEEAYVNNVRSLYLEVLGDNYS